MSYYQTDLQGSGTPADPFIINSYEDWKLIDARHGVDDDPPHYKLTTDIDLYSEHETFKGADFMGGTLWMDNHAIRNPKLQLDSYCIKFCNIIGGDLETLKPNGQVAHIGGEGQIVNITGNKVKTIFNKCFFKRMFVDIDATDMWIDDDEAMSLTGQIGALQSFIRIKNESIRVKPLVAALPVDGDISFRDTCLEFLGNAFDQPLIYVFHEGEYAELIMEKCAIYGDLDCEQMSYYHDSNPAPFMVDGGVSSCIFSVNAKGARDERGWKAYARAIYNENGPSIAAIHSGCYVADRNEPTSHDHGAIPITRVDERTFVDPDILKNEYQFDVSRTR